MKTRVILAVLALSACTRIRSGPTSHGSLVFDGKGADGSPDAVHLSTEADILKSDLVLARVKTQVGALDGSAISISTHGGDRQLDVAVTDPDPKRAALLCNALLSAYLQQHYEKRLGHTKEHLDAVQAEFAALDAGGPEADAQRQRLLKQAGENDVRVLQKCGPATNVP